MINPVQRLYDEVFHFVSSDDSLRVSAAEEKNLMMEERMEI